MFSVVTWCFAQEICLSFLLQYWSLWIGAVLFHCLMCVLSHESNSHVLHIGGIFPIAGEGGWQGGQACMPAAELALEDVNRRRDLLPGYVLRLHSNDSEVSVYVTFLIYNFEKYHIHNVVLQKYWSSHII